MKQLDLFTGKESDYEPKLTFYYSHFETPQDLEFLLTKLNVVEVGLWYLGDTMKKRPISPNYQGLCPFHKEKTPSFYLKPRQNRCKCYGCLFSAGPLGLDFELGGKIYGTIARQANIEHLLPAPSLDMIKMPSDISTNQRDFMKIVTAAFQREQHY